jgi:hypothetical protein
VPIRDERSCRCRAQRIKRDGSFSLPSAPSLPSRWPPGKLDEPPIEGWICPAMFRYYKSAPKALSVMAEPKRR